MTAFLNVAIVIPAHNRKSITLDCLQKLTKIDVTGIALQIIVVDDGSTDGTSGAVQERFTSVTVLKGDGNLWWSGATNLGVAHALHNGADYVLTLNDDVAFEPDFLLRMLETAEKTPKSIVCCLICYENRPDVVLSAGRYRAGFLGYTTPAKYADQNVAAVTEEILSTELESGYAMLIPVDLFQLIGSFNAEKFPHHMGDMDFVLRARNAGYPVLVNTKARLYTNPGKNYLFNVMVENDFKSLLNSFFDIRSNAHWKIRYNFMKAHTKPAIMAHISFAYYLSRMSILLFLKLLLPQSIMRRVAEQRYGKEVYQNQR